MHGQKGVKMARQEMSNKKKIIKKCSGVSNTERKPGTKFYHKNFKNITVI